MALPTKLDAAVGRFFNKRPGIKKTVFYSLLALPAVTLVALVTALTLGAWLAMETKADMYDRTNHVMAPVDQPLE